MLDLKAIREAPEPVLAALARRKDGSEDRLREAIELDRRRRELLPQVEDLRARQNAANDAIAEAKRSGDGADAAIAEMKEVSGRVKQLKEELDAVEEQLATTLGSVPNPPSESAAEADTVLREYGENKLPEGRDHLELAGDLIDMEAGARLSGARFAYLKGDIVRLELAIVQYTLSKLGGEGFTPVIPPVLVRERALFGTGFLASTRSSRRRSRSSSRATARPRTSRTWRNG